MHFKTFFSILFISAIVVAISPLLIPETVTEHNQLRHLRFGAPFTFIEQESSSQLPEEVFPQKLTLLSPWENPTRILWGNFFVSIISVLTVFSILYVVFTRRCRHR